MKNETIKTYTEVTVAEAGELLRDNGWKPVKGMALRDCGDRSWKHCDLTGIVTDEDEEPEFHTQTNYHFKCAKVTELDPCVAPDGCPELEPWMAYVGLLSDQTRTGIQLQYPFHANEPFSDDWDTTCRGGCNDAWPCCIDVRAAWSQENFPEHCRIRNYQEPDPLEDWVYDRFCKKGIDPTATYMSTGQMLKDLYKLGQQNPIK